ncbi:hypothetical protein [Paenisporosarcina sp. TG-14]|uniref:hypothetical protein n=1 Tax=Paenisporosarcina sp. TG-14 TaxID=1231057 RepID=UPI0002D260AE|nr:hypothetical protein [Paenisporosarcina sp. TG-14]
MKTMLRLYQLGNTNYRSTFFDLIHGDTETKQTKGLSYLFSKYPELIELFLKKVDRQLTQQNPKFMQEIDFVQVDAEMLSVGETKIRRDITLSFFQRSIKRLVIVIEAKSASTGVINEADLTSQLTAYLDPINFPWDVNVPMIGITLTKHKVLHPPNSGFSSLTWTDMVGLIKELISKEKKSGGEITIAEEFLDFIYGVRKAMKYYEVEVLSVAAGKTHELTKKHFVHACPHNAKGFLYKTPIYMTFRSSGGGEMEFLYKTEEIVVLNPLSPSLDISLEGIQKDFATRIKEYITDRIEGFGFTHQGEDYRFYNLSSKDVIHLKHLPKPPANNSGARYYSIAELIKGEKVVSVASQDK